MQFKTCPPFLHGGNDNRFHGDTPRAVLKHQVQIYHLTRSPSRPAASHPGYTAQPTSAGRLPHDGERGHVQSHPGARLQLRLVQLGRNNRSVCSWKRSALLLFVPSQKLNCIQIKNGILSKTERWARQYACKCILLAEWAKVARIDQKYFELPSEPTGSHCPYNLEFK